MIRISYALFLGFAVAITTHGMENIPPKIERKRASHQLTQSTPSLSSSIEKSQRKNVIKRHSNSLAQSIPYDSCNMENTSPKIEITPPTTENTSQKTKKKHSSIPLTRSTPPLPSSIEKSPRKSVSHDDSDTEDPLLDAVKKNDFNRIQRILNINMPDKEGNTPFIIAAKNGYKKIIIELLRQPTLQPNMKNLCKMTALHCAAEKNHIKIINILVLDPRIDASIMNENRHTVRELINKSNTSLRKKLFGRITLDQFVNNELSVLQKLMNNKLMINLTDQDLSIAIKMIKRNLMTVADKQAEKLSKSAIIPNYATDEFIGKMIKWRFFYHNETTTPALDQALLSQQPVTTNNLESKEISSIYL